MEPKKKPTGAQVGLLLEAGIEILPNRVVEMFLHRQRGFGGTYVDEHEFMRVFKSGKKSKIKALAERMVKGNPLPTKSKIAIKAKKAGVSGIELSAAELVLHLIRNHSFTEIDLHEGPNYFNRKFKASAKIIVDNHVENKSLKGFLHKRLKNTKTLIYHGLSPTHPTFRR